MNKLKKIISILMVMVIIFTGGCASKEDETPITVALSDDIVSLDAAGTKDVISETVARCIYSTLYTFDEKMELTPCLAESSERVSESEWKFSLKKNAKFHDGSPITASDVKYSIDRAMSIEKAEKALLIIANVEAVDPYTVKVTTVEPVANLPSIFVRVSTSIMSEKALNSSNYDFNKPIGSGPFKVIERKEGESVQLERFDEYFFEPAQSKFLTFVVKPSDQDSTASLLNKNIDVAFRVSAADCDYLKLNSGVKIYEQDSTKMELFLFNTSKTPLNDLRVRQAISYAVNKQNIVDNVVGGYGKPLSSVIPPPILGAIDFEGFTYDPEKSRQLLSEAGYSDGFDLTVLTFDTQRKMLMEYLKLDLAKVGIRLNYEFLNLAEYLDLVEKNEYMATIMSWTSNADPDSTFSQIYSKSGHATVNQSKFTDPRVEELLIQGKLESNIEKRKAIYEEASRIVAESYYVLPLYQPSVLVATGSEIKGVRINPQGIFGYDSLYREGANK